MYDVNTSICTRTSAMSFVTPVSAVIYLITRHVMLNAFATMTNKFAYFAISTSFKLRKNNSICIFSLENLFLYHLLALENDTEIMHRINRTCAVLSRCIQHLQILSTDKFIEKGREKTICQPSLSH